MKTKFVYIVSASAKNIYLEQALVSAWSLRYYNSEAYIVLVCDEETRELLNKGWQKEYVCLFNEFKVCHYENDQSLKYRSRHMKTNLRSIVSGDFVYIDTDTIICSDLGFVDEFTFDIGFVPDNNCSFDKLLVHKNVVAWMRQIYDMDVSMEKEYYNGGVFYVKDTEIAHSFFEKWHENWCYEIAHSSSMLDQQSLMKTNIDMGYLITEMDGKMNSQVVTSIRHMHNAVIVHIINNFIGKDTNVTPFHSLDAYRQIKECGFSDEWKYKALHFKELFCSPSFVLSESNALIWRHINEDGCLPIVNSYTVKTLAKIRFKCPWMFNGIEKMFEAFYKFVRLIKGCSINSHR